MPWQGGRAEGWQRGGSLQFPTCCTASLTVTTTRAPPTTQHGTTEKGPCPRTPDTGSPGAGREEGDGCALVH